MSPEGVSPSPPLADAAAAVGPARRVGSSLAEFRRFVARGPRARHRHWTALVRSADHEQILTSIRDDATFSFNYAFMIGIAAGSARRRR